MPGGSPDRPAGDAPDPWDRDDWKNDAWARDDWKHSEWGKAAPPRKPSADKKVEGGFASYQRGMLEAGPYLTLGLQIAFGMVLFVGLGYGADHLLGTTPWGMIVGAAIGLIAVFTLVVRIARRADARTQSNRPQGRSPKRR